MASSRGGFREGAGRPGAWKHGETKMIRVPIALSEEVLDIARRLDEGYSIDCDSNSKEVSSHPKVEKAIALLTEALKLKANAGGAIKAEIRKALDLLK